MKAEIYLQPDNRHHLIITLNPLEEIYVRPSCRDLKALLSGNADFVEYGCYSKEAKRAYRKIAELFRAGKVEEVIIRSYAVKPKIEIKANPKDINIEDGIKCKIKVGTKTIIIGLHKLEVIE